jgi:hypothetical protein
VTSPKTGISGIESYEGRASTDVKGPEDGGFATIELNSAFAAWNVAEQGSFTIVSMSTGRGFWASVGKSGQSKKPPSIPDS